MCSFRSNLYKRSPVDGFDRLDIFFIDPSGRTIAPCFQELENLMGTAVPAWFENFDSIELLLRHKEDATPVGTSNPAPLKGSLFPNFGCLAYCDIVAMLQLLAFETEPSSERAAVALRGIENLTDVTLDIASRFDGALGTESKTERIHTLLQRLEAEPTGRRLLACFPGSANILAERWDAPPLPTNTENEAQPVASPDCRKDFWPKLKGSDFSEFTNRLAHRVRAGRVEVIEILPTDPYERRHCGLPAGQFRVAVGIFWPELAEQSFRTAKGQPRPQAMECHLSLWLLPPQFCAASRTLFSSVQDAREQIEEEGLAWLDRFADPEFCLSYLQKTTV